MEIYYPNLTKKTSLFNPKTIIKMKNQIPVLFLLLYSVFISAQDKTIQGTILDSLKNPIKYANIGILNKPIGSVSDENGKFKFILENVTDSDTLKISCLGYKSKEIIIKNMRNNNEDNINISLKNYTEQLSEVKINKSDLKNYSEGKDKTDTKRQVIFANPNYKNLNLGSEIGKKFSLGDKKPSFLTDFKFFIKDNNFDMVKFRINVYSIKNNKPYKKIDKANILVEVDKKRTDWVNVDLSQFDITIQEDIIVTVEWVEHSNDGNKLNLPIIIPSFGSTHYYKFGSQGTWERYGKISSAMVLIYKQ